MCFHWEKGLVLCYRQRIDFKFQISWYNDMSNECCILNPQLWKWCFLTYQNQRRCSVTDGEPDHPSLSLWVAETSLRGICVKRWLSWGRWMFGGTCLAVWLQAAQPKTLSVSMRRPPASPVLLDLLCVGSTGVSQIPGEGCYLKIKVDGPWLQTRCIRSSF